MVGLPARGKSFTARKLHRYLRWLSISCAIFNVGQYRRVQKPQAEAAFFDPNNAEGSRVRREAAEAAMRDLHQFILGQDTQCVAIYDATNTSRERRAWIAEQLRGKAELLFVELICQDDQLVETSIRGIKATGTDYASAALDAVSDFRARIGHYQRVYQPVSTEERVSFVKCIDLGQRWDVFWEGSKPVLLTRIVFFLMSTAGGGIQEKMLWMTRHGETELNVAGRIGGDSVLSRRGEAFASELGSVLAGLRLDAVWTSTLRRTIQTATLAARGTPHPAAVVRWRALDELHAGDFDGMTYEEIALADPALAARRSVQKFRVRYSGGGESYADLVDRLQPVILELERSRHRAVLIIGHQAVLRCLQGYFCGVRMEEAAFLEIPLHQLFGLDINAYETPPRVRQIAVPVEAVSTHVPRGCRYDRTQ